MIFLYKAILSTIGAPLLKRILKKRIRAGKEDESRINERMGITEKERPHGKLIWLHAASVGEAQSALILIEALLLKYKDRHIMVTTGTKTSADLMSKRLPDRAFHQFYPLDHPSWTKKFLTHWKPDLVLWMESELWPNMLLEIKKQNIPAFLINARMSPRSLKRWRLLGSAARTMLSSFSAILCQTDTDKKSYETLGAKNVHVTDNLKYSASPLPCDKGAFDKLKNATKGRLLWLYASTHAGEEHLACALHKKLKKEFPTLLTIIVPRHPERRTEIKETCDKENIISRLRGEFRKLPDNNTDIYIADTLGELGLFYSLSPIAVIGRSFSDDGGGGHNPIEAALLNCATLHGPYVQNLAQIFDEMDKAGAALELKNTQDFEDTLRKLFNDRKMLCDLRNAGLSFASKKSGIVGKVMEHIDSPLSSPTPCNETGQAQASA